MITNIDELKSIVNNVIRSFNKNETYLLKNDTSERNICSKFATYLENEIQKRNEFYEYTVDSEYNRGYNGEDSAPKELDGKKISLDLIVHKRGYDAKGIGYDNLICIEMKKVGNNEGYKNDELRLQKLTDPNGNFYYKMGCMIRISSKKM